MASRLAAALLLLLSARAGRAQAGLEDDVVMDYCAALEMTGGDVEAALEIAPEGTNGPRGDCGGGLANPEPCGAFDLACLGSSRMSATSNPAVYNTDHWFPNAKVNGTTVGLYEIPYIISNSFPSDLREKIRNALNDLGWRSGVVKFVAYNRSRHGNKRRLKVELGSACRSYIGSYPSMPEQIITLRKGCAKRFRVVQHEFLHALGFWHEHSRSDRDTWIDVFEENIKSNYLYDYQKRAATSIFATGMKYDYKSIMHYKSNYGKKKGAGPTMLGKDGSFLKPAGRATKLDLLELRLLYQCAPGVGPRTFNQYKNDPCPPNCREYHACACADARKAVSDCNRQKCNSLRWLRRVRDDKCGYLDGMGM